MFLAVPAMKTFHSWRSNDSTDQCAWVGATMSDKWDERFLDLATHISGWSKDPSTKVGCVVVGEDREIRSTGFNGFPRGISDDNDRLCLLYTSPSPRDRQKSRMPSSA